MTPLLLLDNGLLLLLLLIFRRSLPGLLLVSKLTYSMSGNEDLIGIEFNPSPIKVFIFLSFSSLLFNQIVARKYVLSIQCLQIMHNLKI